MDLKRKTENPTTDEPAQKKQKITSEGVIISEVPDDTMAVEAPTTTPENPENAKSSERLTPQQIKENLKKKLDELMSDIEVKPDDLRFFPFSI